MPQNRTQVSCAARGLEADDGGRSLPARLSFVRQARVVRVRIAGEQAFLTIKGLMRGITWLEFEYAIPRNRRGPGV
jgi:CYTH domain-containing protein